MGGVHTDCLSAPVSSRLRRGDTSPYIIKAGETRPKSSRKGSKTSRIRARITILLAPCASPDGWLTAAELECWITNVWKHGTETPFFKKFLAKNWY